MLQVSNHHGITKLTYGVCAGHVKLSSKYSSDELAPNHINANYIKVVMAGHVVTLLLLLTCS